MTIHSATQQPGQAIVRRKPRPLALEQRFMFDGAALDTALHTLDGGRDSAAAASAAGPQAFDLSHLGSSPNVLAVARLDANQLLSAYLQQAGTPEQLFTLFNGGQSTPSAAWLQAAQSLRQAILEGRYSVGVQTLDSTQMGYAMGAFAAQGPNGQPVIYLNQDWVASGASAEQVAHVLLEELGHSLDAQLNPQSDTAGDEGERFAATVTGADTSSPGFASDDDHVTLHLDGHDYALELATYTFVNAYQVNTATTPAGKESNTHDFTFTGSVTPVVINDGNFNSALFSGNDVSATALQIGGVDYYGWISRPIKVGGQVKGFYFWTDAQFANLALAQADGNADGDGNVADNRAFVLVVDQSYFDTLAFNSGSSTLKNVGSSSDRVDTALNALLPVNVAPVAVADTALATEAGGLANATAGTDPSGNVLSNDTDANSGDSKTVLAVGTTAASQGVAAGSTSSSNQTSVAGSYCTLTLGADGSYKYTVNNSLSAVNALRSTANTLSDTFTYTVKDSAGATSTTTLTVTVQGANDTPLAVADYGSAKISLLSDGTEYTSTDTLGSKATGNVLSNDTDVDRYGETKAIFGLEASGTYSSYTPATSSTSLSFSASNGSFFNGVAVGDYLYTANLGGNSYYHLRTAAGVSIQVTSKATNADGTFSIGLSGAIDHYSTSTAYPITSGVTKVDFATANLATDGNNITGTKKEATVNASTLVQTSTLTLSGITGNVVAGMTVSGSNIPNGSKVLSVAGSTITIDQSITTAPSGLISFLAASGSNVTGTLGSLVLNSDGSYTYTPFSNAAGGPGGTDTFSYTMVDAGGLSSKSTLSITVQASTASDPNARDDLVSGTEGVNGAAGTNPAGNVIAGTISSGSGTGGADTSTTTVTSGRTAAASADVAIAASSFQDFVGLYGTLHLTSTGAYTYTIDNSNTTVDALNAGASLSEVFFYTISTAGGLKDTAQLKFTINGANDAPLAVNDSASAVEASGTANATPGYDPAGNVLQNDSDVDDLASALQVSSVRVGATEGSGTAGTLGSALAGSYGSLTLGANGNWSYAVNNSNVAVNNLAPGQSLSESFNYTVRDTAGSTDTGVITITIQGAADSVAVNTVFVNEASPYAVFTVSGAQGVSVSLALGNSTGLASSDARATLGTDLGTALEYFNGSAWVAYSSGSVALPASGQLLVRMAITQDNVHEGNESFTLTATTTDGNAAIGIGTISDEGVGDVYLAGNTSGTPSSSASPGYPALDDDRPTLSVSSPTLVEGGMAEFSVSIDKTSTESIAFSPLLTSGTATVGTDTAATNTLEYSTDGGSNWFTVSGPVSIAAGQSAVKLRIATVDDTIVETLETFTLDTGYVSGTVRNASGASGTASIIDNDGMPSLSIGDVTVNEAAGTATFTVTRTGNSSGTSSVDYATGDVTATAGADYTATSGSLSFAAGETSKTFTVAIANDAVYEGSETYTVTLGNAAGATISSSTATGTIKDDGTGAGGTDNDTPTVSVSSVTVSEASPYAVFQVSLSNASSTAIAFTPTLSSGTATVGSDTGSTLEYFDGTAWVSATGGISIAAGQTSVLVRTAIINDSTYEGSESFSLSTGAITGTVSNAIGASGTGTIKDDGSSTNTFSGSNNTATPSVGTADNDTPTIAVNSVTVSESSPYAVFQVSLSNASSTAIAFTPTLSSGTATIGSDTGSTLEYFNGTAWVSAAGGISIAAGQTSVLVRTAIINDSTYEGSESFTLSTGTITGTVSNAIGASGTGTIKDDGSSTNTFGGSNNTATPSVGTADNDTPVAAPAVTPVAPTPASPPVVVAPAVIAVVEPNEVAAPPSVIRVNPTSALDTRTSSTPLRLTVGDALTSKAGFQVVVTESVTTGLALQHGMSDQFVERNHEVRFSLPHDTFVHSDPTAVITLQAQQADGTALPSWVRFDGQTGVFSIEAPASFVGDLQLVVIARDQEGHEVCALFRMFVGQDKGKTTGRASLTEKLQLAGQRAWTERTVRHATPALALRTAVQARSA